MQQDFLDLLESIRILYRRPMRLSSAYRHPTKHPVEAKKAVPGMHAQGRAVDVLVHGSDAMELIAIALMQGMRGLGVSQKGPHASRFIHLDDRDTLMIWSY